MIEAARHLCRDMREHRRGGTLHSVDWLLLSARMLRLLREDRLCSKTEVAAWGVRNVRGEWRHLLPRAAEIRRNPHLADAPESALWLDSLTQPIQDACAELEAECAT